MCDARLLITRSHACLRKNAADNRLSDGLHVDPLAVKSNWQRHVLAASGYRELGMFDDAARALEEVDPEDRARIEVLGARLDCYIAAKNWAMAVEVARHLIEVEPENAGWWINLAYATRRTESLERAEAFLLRAHKLHPNNAIIAFNLACYACVMGRLEEAKVHLEHAIALDTKIRTLALHDEDLKPLWDWLKDSA
jgi:Flp pilus assembly protein TadD